MTKPYFDPNLPLHRNARVPLDHPLALPDAVDPVDVALIALDSPPVLEDEPAYLQATLDEPFEAI